MCFSARNNFTQIRPHRPCVESGSYLFSIFYHFYFLLNEFFSFFLSHPPPTSPPSPCLSACLSVCLFSGFTPTFHHPRRRSTLPTLQACAPRYVWFSRNFKRREPVGTCYTAKNNFAEFFEYSPCRTSKLVSCGAPFREKSETNLNSLNTPPPFHPPPLIKLLKNFLNLSTASRYAKRPFRTKGALI